MTKTVLERVNDILESEPKDFEDNFLYKPIRPDKKIPIHFNEFNIPNNRSKKCLKEKLSKVLAFMEWKKSSRFSEGLTVMNIATTSKKMQFICGSQRNASRLIQFIKQIGLIADYDSSYQYNAYKKRLNRCKKYVYNKKVEDMIKAYCKEKKINKYGKSNNIKSEKHINSVVRKFSTFDSNKVRFSSKLALHKPENIGNAEFEAFLTEILYENYPALSYYQKLADSINTKYYVNDPLRQLTFKPTFTWDKGKKQIKKIGIRCTNQLVSTKKQKEDGDPDNLLYRQDVLNKYNLKSEYDVTSSVPRVTYLINHGEWLKDEIDLYELMYQKYIKRCPEEDMGWSKKTRKIFKSFHMRGYFDTYERVVDISNMQ